MKFFRIVRRFCCLVLPLALLAGGCPAEGAEVEDRGVDLNEEISVRYPAVTGLEDAELNETVNARILEDCRVKEYLERATALISGGSLRVSWTGGILGDVFSCVLSAEGGLRTGRTEHAWTAANVDLRDGRGITLEELFTDGDAARECMEDYLEEYVEPELSAHLANSELLPLPETFVLERTGLTLLYPADSLSTLSDRAGAVRIGWNVLRPVLNLEEDSIPVRIGVPGMINLTEESGRKLLEEAAGGSLPGIPAAVGDSMQALTDRHHMLTDPDGYEGGRLFSLEGSSFRGVYLMTDDLGRGWEDSRVEGIRMDQGCAWGLCVGETMRADWLAALGEPAYSAEIGGEKAEANRIVPGMCDYYSCGDHQLLLYSDENEELVSIVLAR